MINLEEFRIRLRNRSMSKFNEFWQWKIRTETNREHILDDAHRNQACSKLWLILRGWQTYRPYASDACLGILKDALKNIADSYNQIRTYSLPQFNKVPDKPLNIIWHELGRVKEKEGKKNDYGFYHIVSSSKHLMFLWGQTPAFDSKVRIHIPRSYNASKNNRWHFEEWKKVMLSFQKDLMQEPEVVEGFKAESLRMYGSESIVPYGRFFDIYYSQSLIP